MIVCDADNITERCARPSPEVIQEEWRQQLEALKALRRRLTHVVGPRVVGYVPSSN